MNEKRFPVIVYIRHNATGEIRQYSDELVEESDGGQPSIFIWEAGNYSCDCNRQLFFNRVKNEDEEWNSDCSDGQFSVHIVDAKTGEGYYKEFELPSELLEVKP